MSAQIISFFISLYFFKLSYGNNIGTAEDEMFKKQERLAELFYKNQLGEREKATQMRFEYPHINANYPCFYGENAIGQPTSGSIDDGHKYACGLLAIKNPPIVYSFGSNSKQDFELGVLSLRPGCNVVLNIVKLLLIHNSMFTFYIQMRKFLCSK